MDVDTKIQVDPEQLIEFINFVNECCVVMDDEYVAEWITKPHDFLNMETPLTVFTESGTEKLYHLLYFIEKDEADL